MNEEFWKKFREKDITKFDKALSKLAGNDVTFDSEEDSSSDASDNGTDSEDKN